MSVKRRVRMAIFKRCPDDGIIEWLDTLAHAVGYGESTVKDWYYGKAEPTPDALADLFAYFGDEFQDEVYPRKGAK